MIWEEIKGWLRQHPVDGMEEKELQAFIGSLEEEQDADLISVDPDDVLNLLRGPGTLRSFCEEAVWEDRSARTAAVDKLCAGLERKAAVGRAEYGDCQRILLQIEGNDDIGLEEVERCVRALDPAHSNALVIHVRAGRDNTVRVRGLMGARDGAR